MVWIMSDLQCNKKLKGKKAMKKLFRSHVSLATSLLGVVIGLSGCAVDSNQTDYQRNNSAYENSSAGVNYETDQPGYSYQNGTAAEGFANEPVNDDTFYTSLSPFGRWIDSPQYGRVWVPNADRGFEPYRTNGHWIYSDYGWTWVSDYNWGWAPFHYGRWAVSPEYGWYWVPGRTWGPAWVAWRHSNDYYGWAPLGPGYAAGEYGSYNSIPARHWCFVRSNYIGESHMDRYYEPARNNITIINNTTIINNYRTGRNRSETYIAGPAPAEVARFTGRPVTQVPVPSPARPAITAQRPGRFMMVDPRPSASPLSRSVIRDYSNQPRPGFQRAVPGVAPSPGQQRANNTFQSMPQRQPQRGYQENSQNTPVQPPMRASRSLPPNQVPMQNSPASRQSSPASEQSSPAAGSMQLRQPAASPGEGINNNQRRRISL